MGVSRMRLRWCSREDRSKCTTVHRMNHFFSASWTKDGGKRTLCGQPKLQCARIIRQFNQCNIKRAQARLHEERHEKISAHPY